MKPECTHCRERFSDYLDGLLAAPERQEMDAHLAGCAECRRELDLWRATVQAVGELPRRGAPQGFGARVMEGLDAQGAQAPERPRLRSVWLRVLPVAAMLLVVVGVIAIVHRGSAPSPGTAPASLAERLAVPAATEAPVPPAAAPAAGAAPAPLGAPAAPAPYDTSVAAPVAPAEAEHAGAAGGLAYAMRQPAEADGAVKKGLAASRGEAEAVTGLAAGAVAPEKTLRATMDLKVQATVASAAGRLSGDRTLLFQQIAAKPGVTPPPHQVLTMRAKDPADLIRRAVAVANQQGLEVTLVLKPNDQADISIQVPADRYDALVAALVDLTAPQSQALSNTALAQSDFYRQAVANYRAMNSARLEQQVAQAAAATVATDQLTEEARKAPAPEAMRAAGAVVAGAAAPASNAPAASAAPAARPVGGTGGAAPAAARAQAGQVPAAALAAQESASAMQRQAMVVSAPANQGREEAKLKATAAPPAAPAAATPPAAAGPPAVVNLQISILQEP